MNKTQNLQIPEILNIPPKLFPLITDFNKYSYFLLEGGRSSGKTHSVARFLLYIAEKRIVRICCGRETQNTINDSVKTVLSDIIQTFNLNFTIKKDEIIHNETGSRFFFKGFREQGKVNIKGLEGIDILWIDEAQAISKPTLEYVVPTIRKKNSVIIFTMNRYTRFDCVYQFCVGRDDCLHININYFDNPFNDEKVFKEAEIAKTRNIADYEHTWLGIPLSQASDYLINSNSIDSAKSLEFQKERCSGFSVLSVDLSASGGDLCVAKLIKQKSVTQWEESITTTWSEPDTDITKGKIINLYSQLQPDILIMDADGLGYPIWVSVKKVIEDCIGFRGAGKPKSLSTGNQRADGYMALKEFIENGWLKLKDENSTRQVEYMKRIFKPNGLIYIQDKKDIRKEHSESPDYADSLMMGIYAIKYHAHLFGLKQQKKEQTYSVVNSDFDPFED